MPEESAQLCQGLLFSVMVDIDVNAIKREILPALFKVNYLYFHPEEALSNRLKAIYANL